MVAEVGTAQTVHVILDNYSTHKKNDPWLAAHPNVHFHFTSTSASWLNRVEIWFDILARKTLCGASFASQSAASFVWRKREVRGAQIGNTIVSLRN